jgi:hypothetical protein
VPWKLAPASWLHIAVSAAKYSPHSRVLAESVPVALAPFTFPFIQILFIFFSMVQLLLFCHTPSPLLIVSGFIIIYRHASSHLCHLKIKCSIFWLKLYVRSEPPQKRPSFEHMRDPVLFTLLGALWGPMGSFISHSVSVSS